MFSASSEMSGTFILLCVEPDLDFQIAGDKLYVQCVNPSGDYKPVFVKENDEKLSNVGLFFFFFPPVYYLWIASSVV